LVTLLHQSQSDSVVITLVMRLGKTKVLEQMTSYNIDTTC